MKNSKKDPRRINRIMNLIHIIWLLNPDLGLCQLIDNCFEAGDLYFKEDDILEKKLNEIYLGGKK